MEEKKAIVYFKYQISYSRGFSNAIPIYDFGDKSPVRRPICNAVVEEQITGDRDVFPRVFETKEEAEEARNYFEKSGLFSDFRVERILDHIEILDEKSSE